MKTVSFGWSDGDGSKSPSFGSMTASETKVEFGIKDLALACYIHSTYLQYECSRNRGVSCWRFGVQLSYSSKICATDQGSKSKSAAIDSEP